MHLCNYNQKRGRPGTSEHCQHWHVVLPDAHAFVPRDLSPRRGFQGFIFLICPEKTILQGFLYICFLYPPETITGHKKIHHPSPQKINGTLRSPQKRISGINIFLLMAGFGKEKKSCVFLLLSVPLDFEVEPSLALARGLVVVGGGSGELPR